MQVFQADVGGKSCKNHAKASVLDQKLMEYGENCLIIWLEEAKRRNPGMDSLWQALTTGHPIASDLATSQ